MKKSIYELNKMHRFWETLDEWSDPTVKVFHHHEKINEFTVAEMHKECLNFTDWMHASTDPAYAPVSFRNYLAKTRNYNRFKHLQWVNSTAKKWDRWLTPPTEEHFPTIWKFLQENKHQYINPMISKLGAGEHIRVHNHGGRGPPFVYNMSLNYPKGCKFAVYPQGMVPYEAGDIYRLHIHNDHAVFNNTDTVRYHLLLRPVDGTY